MPIDYSRYPSNWRSEIVPAVLTRANNCCEECGLQNKQIVYSVRFNIRIPETGRYKDRSIWFSSRSDAIREAGGERNVKEVKVILTISHTDHDETNHNVSLDRLKALCQACHLRYDANEKYRRITSKWENNEANNK